MPSNNLNEKVMGVVVTSLAVAGFSAIPALDKDGSVFGWNIKRVYTNLFEKTVHFFDEPVAFIAMDDADTIRLSRHPNAGADVEKVLTDLSARLLSEFGINDEDSFWEQE